MVVIISKKVRKNQCIFVSYVWGSCNRISSLIFWRGIWGWGSSFINRRIRDCRRRFSFWRKLLREFRVRGLWLAKSEEWSWVMDIMCFLFLGFGKWKVGLEVIGSSDGPVVRISDCLSDGPSSNLGQDAFLFSASTSHHIHILYHLYHSLSS